MRGRGYWSQNITDEQYLAKLMSKCVRLPSGCLVWQGWKNWKGYGEMGYRGRSWFVHRLVYTLKIGPIPPGMLVCHTCDVRACCDEDHLFLGTEEDNNRDCGNKGRHHNSVKTHCKYGHEFTFENTYLKVTAKTVMRACRECMRIKSKREWENGKAVERQRRYRAKLRAQKMGASQ